MPVREPYPSAVLDEKVQQMLHNSRAELDVPSAASSLQGLGKSPNPIPSPVPLFPISSLIYVCAWIISL
jgi:hypothetical protein